MALARRRGAVLRPTWLLDGHRHDGGACGLRWFIPPDGWAEIQIPGPVVSCGGEQLEEAIDVGLCLVNNGGMA